MTLVPCLLWAAAAFASLPQLARAQTPPDSTATPTQTSTQAPDPFAPTTPSTPAATPAPDPAPRPASTTSAAAPENADGTVSKQKTRGFAVYLGLGSHLPVVQIDATNAIGTSGFSGSLFAGYKIDRIIVGLGLDIASFGTTTQYAAPSGMATGSRTDTSFLISPGLQVAIVRSPEKRVELLGAFQIGFGRTVTSQSQDPALTPDLLPATDQSNFHLNYQVGPGLRFYLHPQFALSVISGIEGDHFFATQNNPSGRRADTLSTVSVFGTLGALGVF
jgi:hypothetical protein